MRQLRTGDRWHSVRFHLVHQGLEAPSLILIAQSIDGRQLCMRHAQLLQLCCVLRH